MTKYKVIKHYVTHFECDVEASSKEEAQTLAGEVFQNTSDEEIGQTFFRNRDFDYESVIRME